MATPATQVTAGDIDGDSTDDLVGIWPGQGGVWVKYSSTGTWQRLSSTADWIACGKMRGGAGSAGLVYLQAPVGGYAEGPGDVVNYEDLSSEGPGGWDFVYQEEKNLIPQEQGELKIVRIPGPGELGFKYIEQRNLVPKEGIKGRKIKKR